MAAMTTPQEVWQSYRNYICEEEGSIGDDNVEYEAERAFYAGSEAVFKMLADSFDLHPKEAFTRLREYREMNRERAMEILPDDNESEEQQ